MFIHALNADTLDLAAVLLLLPVIRLPLVKGFTRTASGRHCRMICEVTDMKLKSVLVRKYQRYRYGKWEDVCQHLRSLPSR